LAQVLIAEADAFVELWEDLKLPDGRDRVVRHGHGPHRAIQTGIGLSRRTRLLEGDRGGLSEHQAPAVLGSQDRQRAE
jgi:hypothetical protein